LALPYQVVSAGRLEQAYAAELKRLRAEKAVERLWAKDTTLWPTDESHAESIENRLGWIGLPDRMRQEAAEIEVFTAEVEDAGLRDIVLVGTGESTLAAEVFTKTFPAPEGRRLFLLDSTDPDTIRTLSRELELERTLFLVASKSGKAIETISQFLYFLDLAKTAGIGPPGPHFAGITDEGTFLSRLGPPYGFRRMFLEAQDIGGRYSALSYFGLVPAALWGVSLEPVLDRSIEMREACGPDAKGPNPAGELAALLATAEVQGHDRLVLLATPSLVPLSHWIEQLVAGSLGKERRGIVPVAGEVPLTLPAYEEGCIVAVLRQQIEDAAAITDAARELNARGAPVVDIKLASPHDLGAEFFRWEAAAALAAAMLGVNPFDEPDEQESRERTLRMLDELGKKGALPSATVRLSEVGISLYAEGRTRQEISTLRLADALQTFFELRRKEGYLALLAFIEWNVENYQMLGRIRARLTEALGIPVLLECGPRYLHSLGQLLKAGPPTGMYLIITAAHQEDVAVPGAPYSFGQLLMAQALGDLESLQRRDKLVLRLHLQDGAAKGLAHLVPAVEQAAVKVRARG